MAMSVIEALMTSPCVRGGFFVISPESGFRQQSHFMLSLLSIHYLPVVGLRNVMMDRGFA